MDHRSRDCSRHTAEEEDENDDDDDDDDVASD